MKKRIVARAVALCLVASALILAGCSDNATKPKVEKPRYPEAATQEIVIDNLVLSYKDHDIDQFAKLLHADYIWCNQASDVLQGLPDHCTRAEEIQHTGNMFLAADGKHPTNPHLNLETLSLVISPGPWTQVMEINGTPCSDCWETTREYMLEVVFSDSGNALVANSLVKLTIVGVDVGGRNVYRIIRCDDMRKI
jgi:hypothetical protein